MPDILLSAFKLKPAEAIAFLRRKGYAFSWNWFDLWREANVKAFSVAKVMRADILQDIRGMVDQAIDDGIPFTSFKKELTPRLQAKGWWGIRETVDKETGLITETQLGSVARLRKIYQTNLQSSYSAGRYRGQRDTAEALPVWTYRIGAADKHTEGCAKLDGFTALATDPIWDTIYPPNHFGCTGRIVAHTQRRADALKLSVSEGVEAKHTAVIGSGEDRKSVKVKGVKLPNGETFFPDPGFDYNPGREPFAPDLGKYDPDIRRQIPPDRSGA
jgi:uncharacterized protein with gpF-like domain